MTSQCFIFILVILYILSFTCCGSPEKPTSGQFKTTIASIKDCTTPSKPFMKNPPVTFETSTHNSTLSGTIVFLRDTRNMKIKVRGFILRNDKWEPAYLINNLDCHGIVLHLICAAMNVKYDRRNCLFSKGTYSFQNIDVNQLLHLWTSTVEYGHILWRSETYSHAGTFSCKEFDTMAEPV